MSIKILTLIKKQLFNKKGFNFFRENSRREAGFTFFPKKAVAEQSEGFTLLEVLVTTAIIGLLFTVSSAIFVNTIRSANKANITNEAKENSSLVLESLERDIHNASDISGGGSTITTKDASGVILVIWTCQTPPAPANNYITRQIGAAGSPLTVTNKDSQNGVNLNDCSFTVSGSGLSALVTVSLSFTEGKGISGAPQDSTTLVSHKASFSARGY